MTKRGVKRGENGGTGGVETAKMAEFLGKTPARVGIYMVKSERSKMVGFVWSRNVDARVRKVKSDYMRGNRQVFVEKMGLRWSGDVEFEVVEECREEIFGLRLRRLAEEWMGKGYQVYGWTGGNAGPGEVVGGKWRPCERLKELAGKHGMDEGEVMELLEQMDTVLGAGAGARPGGGD